jgi:putative restriction endonuclease
MRPPAPRDISGSVCPLHEDSSKDGLMDSMIKERWLAKLRKLRVDVARGDPAPHKPLLMLVVIDLAGQGLLPERILPLAPELAFQFTTYWQIVAYRRTQAPDVRYPFFHLQSDGCWTPMGEDRKPAAERLLARYAELNPGFEACLKDPAFCPDPAHLAWHRRKKFLGAG